MSYCKHGQRITEIGHCTFCYEELRTQLAESEQACVAMKRMFPDPAKLETLATLFDKVDELGEGTVCNEVQKDIRRWAENARQALQSNPGKAVGDVIVALESKCAKMRELIARIPNRLCKLAEFFDAQAESTGFLPSSALAAENRERADEIDAILESEE